MPSVPIVWMSPSFQLQGQYHRWQGRRVQCLQVRWLPWRTRPGIDALNTRHTLDNERLLLNKSTTFGREDGCP